METILVPLDSSSRAEQALPYAHLLAGVLGARVLLLQVLPPEEYWHVHRQPSLHVLRVNGPGGVDTRGCNPVLNLVQQQAADYLATQVVALRQAGIDTETAVRFGAPARIISDVAETAHVGLIVLTAHRASRFRHGLSGSIAAALLHVCTTPLLIIHANGPQHVGPAIQRILVPLDGSPVARQALPLAVRLAGAAHAELILTHAVAPTLEVFPATPLPDVIQDILADAATTELNALMQEMQTQHVLVTTTVTYGNAAEVITNTARQRQVDLIVMTTHGYSGLRRWVVGSVAERILHMTQTPLLLIHAGVEGNN